MSEPAFPRRSLEVEFAAATDTGCVRHSNQDCFGVDGPAGLLIVCDGMGGAAGGEIASELSVAHFLDTAREALRPQAKSFSGQARTALERGVVSANDAVRRRAEAEPRLAGMGSTLVAAHWTATPRSVSVSVINVGDSRAYLFRNGAVRQITRDHSYVAERVREGTMTVAEAELSHLRSVITRAIGVDEEVMPDFFEVKLQAGDTLLLCSDGLIRHMDDDAIATVLGDASGKAQVFCAELIDRACRLGGSDNITVAVLRILRSA